MFRKTLLTLVILAPPAIGTAAFAYPPYPPAREWGAQFAIGYSAPFGSAADFVNGGWNFQGGATVRPHGGPLGVRIDFGANYYDASDSALQGYLDGNASILSLTADAVYEFPTRGPVGALIFGGIGGYRLYANLTVPSYSYGYWCDWWGWCYGGFYPYEAIIDEKTLYKFGLNAGAAVTFRTGGRSQFYLEATYHWSQTSETTEYMPIVIGWRW